MGKHLCILSCHTEQNCCLHLLELMSSSTSMLMRAVMEMMMASEITEMGWLASLWRTLVNQCICVGPRLCLREVCRREGEDSQWEGRKSFISWPMCSFMERPWALCVCVFIFVRRQFFIMCGCDESGVKRETNNNGQNNMITDYSEITSWCSRREDLFPLLPFYENRCVCLSTVPFAVVSKYYTVMEIL